MHFALDHRKRVRGSDINLLRLSKPHVGMFSSQPARASFESSDSASSSLLDDLPDVGDVGGIKVKSPSGVEAQVRICWK